MLTVYPDYESLSVAAAELIRSAARDAFLKRGRFDLVLSGGHTPRRCYELLAPAIRLDVRLKGMLRVFWADERCVPPTDAASNYRMANEALLCPAGIAERNVFRIRGEAPDPAAEAERYASVFPEASDLIVLGMGAEGHTASLFPESPALKEMEKRFVAVTAPVEPPRRISLTPAGLLAARRVVVIVSGADKSAALARVLAEDGSINRTPARLVRDATWLVDRAARG